MARGQTMTLVPHGKELTTQEAADLLHVSRPHLVQLLQDGTIPYYKVGTHRRVRIQDALDYRAKRAVARRQKLDELTELSEEPASHQSPPAQANASAIASTAAATANSTALCTASPSPKAAGTHQPPPT
jgi:excisionase family DNA binding protein